MVSLATGCLSITFGTSEQQIQASDSVANFGRQACETVEVLADFVIKIKQDQDAFVASVLMGQWDEANEIAAPYQLATEYTAEFIKQAMDDYLGSGLTDYQRGQVLGSIMFEVASFAVPAAKVGSVGKLNFLCQLRNAQFYTRFPKAAAALERAITALEAAGAKGCFVAGTAIQTDQGLKNIESIQPGDEVLTRDALTGWQGYKPVTQTFVTHPDRVYHLTYRVRESAQSGDNFGPDGDSGDDEPDGEIVGTGEHPFFVPTAGCFMALAQLAVGAELQLADGRRAEVTTIRGEWPANGERFTTYNFEVADCHTYFVGEQGVWVHNNCDWDGFASKYISKLNRAIVKNGLAPRDAIAAALDNDIISSGEKFNKFFKTATDEFAQMCARGEIAAKDMPTIVDWKRLVTPRASGQVRQLFEEGMLGKAPFHGHHGVCKFWQKTVKKLAGKAWNDLDDVPALILDQAGHTGAGGSIHRIFEANGIGFKDMMDWQRGKRGNLATFKTLVKKSYDDFGRPDVGEVVLKWFVEMGI